jgi:hypothetical protein
VCLYLLHESVHASEPDSIRNPPGCQRSIGAPGKPYNQTGNPVGPLITARPFKGSDGLTALPSKDTRTAWVRSLAARLGELTATRKRRGRQADCH